MVEDGVDGHFVAVNDIQNTSGCPCLHHQLGQTQRHTRVFFRGFQQKSAAGGDGNAEHPHRDHGGKVKWGNARHYTYGLAHAVDIDARPGTLGVLALAQVGYTASEFDDI